MEKLVDLQTERKAEWRLHKAALIYLATEADSFGQQRPTGAAYATIHDVVRGSLGAGAPATKEACAELARALGAAATLSGFLPQNLLYLGARTLAWWRPPGMATMHFNATTAPAADQRGGRTLAKALGKRGGRAPQPGLVFVVTPGSWYVYATPGADRPGASTKMLRAPYFNVWSEGRICTGNVQLPESLSPTSLEQYERAFFGSEFTHPNVHGRERLLDTAGGPYAFWRRMLDSPLETFPQAALVPLNRTLGKLIERIERGKDTND